MESLTISKTQATVRVSPKVYPLEAVYSASYVFLDRAYILLDGDPGYEFIIKIRPKSGTDPETLAREFLNELINYADYGERAKNTKALREMILQRAIITNNPETLAQEEEFEDIDFDDDDFLDDPEGIAVPWEEKYGKKEEEKP